MSERITGQYLSLLIAIQEDPFSTIDEMARKTGASKPTVAKRLKELSERRLYRVKPLLNYYNLGQESVDVLVETDKLKDILRFEEVATKHPYTSYRARCYGQVNGILLQFRTPIGTRKYIEELMKILKDEGNAREYRFLPSGDADSAFTSMKLVGWNEDKMGWEFDWDDWFEKQPKIVSVERRESQPGSSLSWLTLKDTHIIYELMKGSRRKNIDIVEALKRSNIPMTPQTFSRRYQMIRKECICGFRVSFDAAAFDIHNNVLIFGEGNEKEIASLRSKVEKPSIPFESTFRSSGKELLWVLRLQASHLSALLSNLYERLDRMAVCILDYNNSFAYYPWPEYLDEENHKWQDDYDFMVTEVLKS